MYSSRSETTLLQYSTLNLFTIFICIYITTPFKKWFLIVYSTVLNLSFNFPHSGLGASHTTILHVTHTTITTALRENNLIINLFFIIQYRKEDLIRVLSQFALLYSYYTCILLLSISYWIGNWY